MDAESLIRELGLEPLEPEGGYYRETYRSSRIFAVSAHVGSDSERNLSTAIYYLLTPDTFSAMHRLPSDEIFHFYLGDPVTMLLLYPDGAGETVVLGQDVLAGQRVQTAVAAGVWQGARLSQGGRFALMGTTVSPGFDYSDLELGDREQLTMRYPPWAGEVNALTAG